MKPQYRAVDMLCIVVFLCHLKQEHKVSVLVYVSYHAVVQHSIGQWSVFGVLAVQILTDHLDVGLLTHLLSRFHPKADVASVKTYKQ